MLQLPDIANDFKRLEVKKKQYADTKIAQAGETIGAHVIRLPKGAVPDYIKFSPFQDLSWRTFGRYAKSRTTLLQQLDDSLLKAHMKIRPEEYLSYVLMATLVTAITGVIVGIVVGIVLLGFMNVSLVIRLLIAALAIGLLPVMTYFMMLGTPGSKAKARARDINKRIAASMSFISAMASADVNIDVIFKELSRQKVYGEISNEAAWITRDTELLGSDILTAIKKAARRSPSAKFQDFLQGVITTSTSGGQLKPYFLLKAEEYAKENKLEMKSQMETLGMLAESFVTVVVAFPLFLVLILAIMAIVGSGDPDFMVMMLYVIVLMMIPVSQFGFVFVIWNMSKESAM